MAEIEETPRLYVGNLPYVAQREDIENLFKDNNVAIKKIDMSIDPFSGRNPSYCFIDFHDSATAQHVLQTMQGHLVRGRPIKINPKTERKPGGSASARLATRTYDRRGAKPQDVPSVAPADGANPEDAYVFDRWNRDDAAAHWTAPAEEGRRLYVGGLPRIPNQDSLNVEMRELFRGYPVQAVSKLISPHHSQVEDGKSLQRGSLYFCYVDVADAQEARNAVVMLDGLPTPYGGAYKVRPAHASRGAGIVRREQLSGTSKLFVGGLPEYASREALEEVVGGMFKDFTVKHVSKLITPSEIKQTPEKEGHYHYCFVELADAKEARAAVERWEAEFGNGIKVRFARTKDHETPRMGGAGEKQKWRENEIRGTSSSGSGTRAWRQGDLKRDEEGKPQNRAGEARSWRRQDQGLEPGQQAVKRNLGGSWR